MKSVFVTGSFDNLRARDLRFLQEASRLGALHVVLWSDREVESLEGHAPEFSEQERLYLLEAIRYVDRVTLSDGAAARDALAFPPGSLPAVWAVDERSASEAGEAFCRSRGLEYRVFKASDLEGFPEGDTPRENPEGGSTGRKKVVVTGCYDWFHSGHVRFFEEVSELGDLYVVVGHDENLRLLKGEGHPMFPAEVRRYIVGSVRHVRRALISSGHGWMDAEPEIARIRPDMYAVNEDGDRPEKREFCRTHGIEYVVLQRTPKAGLPRRESTHLRGF